jgi:sodium/bile acid cotransporter 7
MAIALFAVVLLLFFVSWAVWQSAKWLDFDEGVRVTAFFTASQKSLATGLPLLTTIFASASVSLDVGLVLVPILLYHPLQLFLGGLLVPQFKGKA